MMSSDSFGARSTLEVGGREYEIHRLDALQERFDVARLPYSLKVLLENVLRLEDGVSVSADDVEAIATWDAKAEPSVEIPFQPARVLMQDFTGVPAVVDLAAMRDAMEELGGDPAAINPLVDVDLVIDHSVQVDAFGNERAFEVNAERDFERNGERYAFLSWGQQAFDNFRVVPPATGICHQVNLEYLAQVVCSREADGVTAGLPRHPGRHRLAHDDDQRPRRARLGRRRDRGRGGDARPADLDAAAAGDRLQARRRAARGRDRDRPRADRDRDAARARRRLQVRRVLRPRACRRSAWPTGRRSATCRRSSARPARSSRSTPRRSATSSSPAARPRRSSWSTPTRASRACSTTTRLRTRPSPTRSSSTSATSCPASPARSGRRTGCRSPTPSRPSSRRWGSSTPRRREQLGQRRATRRSTSPSPPPTRPPRTTTASAASRARRSAARRRRRPSARTGDAVAVTLETATTFELDHGRVVIAAITSCTNTSNPSVMIGAGLLAKNAVERGLTRKPWVKTSLAPGSTVVTDYLEKAGLDRVPRRAPVQPGRLRLHDLHRQLRPAARGDLGGGQRERPRRLRGPLRQPQLRGPDQPGREGQLPRLPAAGRRLRAGRAHGRRPRPPSRSARAPTASRSTCATSGRAPRRSSRWSATRSPRTCSPTTTPTSSPATSAGTRSRCPRATATPGPTRPTCASRPSSRQMPAEPPGSSRSRRPGPRRARRLDHHRPHLARRARSRRTARPAGG